MFNIFLGYVFCNIISLNFMKGTCHECTKTVEGKLASCPMCRAPMPTSGKQFVSLLKKAAKNGSAYAQMKLGWESPH